MKNTLTMRYPASWHGDMWREGAPIGNGVIGGLVYGGAKREIILLNHALLWRGGRQDELPDVSEELTRTRELLDSHRIREADGNIARALREKQFQGELVAPTPVCDIVIDTELEATVSHYRRVVNMEEASVTVSFDAGGIHYTRSVFASRADGRLYLQIKAEHGRFSGRLSLSVHDTETLGSVKIPQAESCAKDGFLYYSARNDSVFHSGDYGAVGSVVTDGVATDDGDGMRIADATAISVCIGVFLETPRCEAFQKLRAELSPQCDYPVALDAHKTVYTPLFRRTELSLCQNTEEGEDLSNEQLLLDAFDEDAPKALIEKLYAYGRYLFLCSTGEAGNRETLPCHLVGLFNGTYQCFWAFYMYNINFEMIYWHTLSGNLPEYLRLALDYTEAFLPDFRENAKKLYGCRGIFINSVNTPESGISKCMANHILNWTGGAAWISQHFWDYYRFTGDEDYLRCHALPFMMESAQFFEDFCVEAEDGYYDLYPSVSPENTASNVIRDFGNNVETCKNATMDYALLHELLTNLIRGAELTGMYADKIPVWKTMIGKLRPYRIEDDGAIAEWVDAYYQAHNEHRHQSHLYPVFPGCEIDTGDPLSEAFERAVDARFTNGLSAQSSWSMLTMAGTAARMGRGDFADTLFTALAKTCLMNNFFTTHNDYRRMGAVWCDDMRLAPFQIDGNIGFPGVVNELLLQSHIDREIRILPALPSRWTHGEVRGLLARGGVVCDIAWEPFGATVTLTAKNVKNCTLRAGSGYCFDDGETERTVSVIGKEVFRFQKSATV